MWIILLKRYWSQLVLLCTLFLSLIYLTAVKIDNYILENDKLVLEYKVKDYKKESERLYKEYEANIQEYDKKSKEVQVKYIDRIKYIKESLNENASCEDTMDAINRYWF